MHQREVHFIFVLTMEEPLLQIIRRAIREEIRLAQSEVLTADEAARFLGLEKSYLYKLTSSGLLPFSKPNGKRIYFARQDLMDWALSNRRKRPGERETDVLTYMGNRKI
jgi:excisionase family DNA binding protein